MSVEEIHKAKQEIVTQLSAENVEFLMERGKMRASVENTREEKKDPVVHFESQENEIEMKDTHHRDDDNHNACIHRTNILNEKQDKSKEEAEEKPLKSNATCDAQLSPAREMLLSQNQIDDELLLRPDNPDQLETDKRKWMVDATEPVESQPEVDDLLRRAIGNLGAIGDLRFDLNGDKLSSNLVDTLPTHLGLHHHGSSPENAGYTLPDILLLTRSSVVAQRVMALRMLKAIVEQHGDDVVIPLVECQGLGLVFARFSSPDAFSTALTNQVAYVEALEALVMSQNRISEHSLLPDMYFSSCLYSALPSGVSLSKMHDVLAGSDCIFTLALIAKTHGLQETHVPLAKRALNVLRAVIYNSLTASQKLLDDEDSLASLQQLCIGFNCLQPDTSMLACDILAHAIAIVCRGRPNFVRMLEKSVLGDNFLSQVCIHLMYLLRDDRKRVSDCRMSAAMGAVRLFRSALSFDKSVMPFSASAQAICQMVYEYDDASVEAYLGLEAYVHCLYVRIHADTNELKRDVESSKSSSKRDVSDERMQQNFVKDQISGLIPVAISAAKLFMSTRSDNFDAKRAAAGHFAATLFAMYPMPFEKSFLVSLFNVCAASSLQISTVTVKMPQDLRRMQTLASVSHAGARLISKVKLEKPFVDRELRLLLPAALAESTFLSKEEPDMLWRPVANACAEWTGILARLDCGVKTIEIALRLLPCISDSQVIIDVLSRCILRVQALQSMNPDMSVDVAQKCARDLLPVALNFLETPLNTSPSNDDEDNDCDIHRQRTPMTVEKLCELWVEQKEVFDSFLIVARAFYMAKIVKPQDMFEMLLLSPIPDSKEQEDHFNLLCSIANGCIENDGKLIRCKDKTIISTKSTATNSKLCNKILSLCEFFVSRGPAALECDALECGGREPLASVILSIMMCNDVDLSLRVAMWRMTVEDCESGLLYQKAEYLVKDTEESINATDVMEGEEMLRAFGTCLVRGHLKGERCPQVLRNILVSQLSSRLHGNLGLEILDNMVYSVPDSARCIASSSLLQIVDGANGNEKNRQAVRKWLNSL